MSNFIYGNIFCDSLSKDDIVLICSSIKNYCINHDIGVHFEKTMLVTFDINSIRFQLSDDFDVLYCEHFMEPIIYTLNGKPIIDPINKNLDVLEGLIKGILCYDSVNKVELKFSYIEVDECEYKEYETNINMMKSVILLEYLKSVQMPVIKIIINK